MYKCGEFLHICPGQNFMPKKFEKGETNSNIAGGNVLPLVGFRGSKFILEAFLADGVSSFSSAKVQRRSDSQKGTCFLNRNDLWLCGF